MITRGLGKDGGGYRCQLEYGTMDRPYPGRQAASFWNRVAKQVTQYIHMEQGLQRAYSMSRIPTNSATYLSNCLATHGC